MTLRVVALAQVPARPWKNGGGLTHDLLAWPDTEDWACRISVAEVVRSGPFSPYPGVERWFAVVQGAGVRLRFGDDELRVTSDSQPLRFDGAMAPDCELIGGDTLDLNLMLRQGRGRGRVERALPAERWQDAAPLRAVYSARAAELFVAGRHVATLPAHALALTTKASGEEWSLGDGAGAPRAWWLSFQPAAKA